MGNTFQIEQVFNLTSIIASISNPVESFETFTSLLKIIPKGHGNILPDLYEIFSEYNYSQIQNFSNNLISYLTYQMNNKLVTLNPTAELSMSFVLSIYKKQRSIREYLPFSYSKILEQGKNPKEIIEHTFPYNIFIFCINTLNNDEFLYQKDIFQKEIDKFEFIRKLTGCIFTLFYFNDYPTIKNLSFPIKYADTIKVFILNNSELYVNNKVKDNFIRKLYNTCINNFDKLVCKRWDPQIAKESFEGFLYMNFFLLVSLLFDVNKFIFNVNNREFFDNKTLNTFNKKTLKVFELLYTIGNDKEKEKEAKAPIQLKDEVISFNNKIKENLKTILLQTSNVFIEFIGKFLSNLNIITSQFKILVYLFLSCCFDVNNDICEMFCLSSDYISKITSHCSLSNPFELMIIYLLSKTKNFYITLKYLNINIVDYSNKLLDNIISNREEKDKKLTYSIYFMLLILKNLTLNMKEIDKEFLTKLRIYQQVLSTIALTQESLFNNIICLSIYYEIFFGFITHLDYPAHVVYSLLISKEDFIELYEKYYIFYKNHFELEEKGRKIWNNFSSLHKECLLFIERTEKKINNEGIDIHYSYENDILGIINKMVFKEKEFKNKVSKVEIFGGIIERYCITTIHSFEEFKILTY